MYEECIEEFDDTFEEILKLNDVNDEYFDDVNDENFDDVKEFNDFKSLKS